MKEPLKQLHQPRIVVTVMASLLFVAQAKASQWPDGIRSVQSCDIAENACRVVHSIVKLPVVIDRPGTYVLENSLHFDDDYGNGWAIEVEAKNVVIDMQGNAVHGPYKGCLHGGRPRGHGSVGVIALSHGFRLKNGLISGFGIGIYADSFSNRRGEDVVSIKKMRIVNIYGTGIDVSGNSLTVQGNQVVNVGGDCVDDAAGIDIFHTGGSSRIDGNIIYNVTNNSDRSSYEGATGFLINGRSGGETRQGIVRMRNNRIYNAWNYGIVVDDANVYMRGTTVVNYQRSGNIGVQVGSDNNNRTTVRYTKTDISGYVDGVVVTGDNQLIDEGNNTVH